MQCSKKMKITSDQFFRYMDDVLVKTLRLKDITELEAGHRYVITQPGKTENVCCITLKEYVKPVYCEVEQEMAKEKRCTRYTVESLPNGEIIVKLDSILQTSSLRKDGSVVWTDNSNNIAMGQSALVQKMQLGSIEKYIRKHY